MTDIVELVKPLFKNKSYSILLIIILCIFIIVFLTCYFTSYECTFFKGGSNNNSKLEQMISNGVLTDEQKITELQETIKKMEIKVTKYNNIYNNLLTNLSSNEEEIDNAERDLEDAKNNLLLAEINLVLKNSLVLLKKNKNPKKKELLEFNVALNTSKQYNIQSIISFHKTKQLKKNTLTAPKDSFFKTELLNSLKETVEYAKQSHIKAKNVYILCIGSSDPEIIKYKADLNSSKNIAKDLEDNIINIKNRIDEKYKLQDSIKNKLLIEKTKTDKKISYEEQITNAEQNTDSLQEKKSTIILEETKKDNNEETKEENKEEDKKETGILDTISNLLNF